MGAGDIPRIEPEELAGRLGKDEKLVVLDVRSIPAYESSDVKIPGSIRKDPIDVESWINDLDESVEYVTYCT